MADSLSHEEISAQFLDSGSVDFESVGRFMSKLGPELVRRDDGLHGVIYGRFNMLACVMRADDLGHVFGGLRGLPGIGEAVDVPRD